MWGTRMVKNRAEVETSHVKGEYVTVYTEFLTSNFWAFTLLLEMLSFI